VTTSFYQRYKRFTQLAAVPFISALIVSCGTSGTSSKDFSAGDQASSSKSYASLDWTLPETAEAAEFMANCQQRFEQADTQFKLLQQSEFSSDLDFLKGMNGLEKTIHNTLAPASLKANVHPNKEVRESAEKCEQNFISLISDIGLSGSLFKRMSRVDQAVLDAKAKRYVGESLREFRRSGVNLDKASQQTLKTLVDEINAIGQDFQKNIREDVRSIVVKNEAELAGLPQDFIDSHRDEASGDVIVTTNYPDYFPVIQYAKSDALRLRVYNEFKNRGYPANEEVLKNLLKKRHQVAELLGYSSYAQYAMETLMIGSPENAQAFITEIADVSADRSEQEYQQLLKRLQKIQPDATEVKDWQKTYIAELVKKEQYKVDSQKVRQYFRYDRVQKGIFELTEKMFRVQIRPMQGDLWHESVTAWEIVERGEVLGQFYLDMHPREGKYQHAAAFTIQDGILDEQLPIKALVCNFPEGDAFMEHGQVETFLHEFGHLLHGIFGGNQPWLAQSGIATERDFVEAPSQMLEEWVWDFTTLKSFAINDKGQSIPSSLIKKLQASRDFGQGLFTRHQMFYAALSLNYYMQDPDTIDMNTMAAELQNKYSNFDFVDGTHFQYSFGHLDGYSAVYYTYMWSLVIADDMFSEFEKNGLLNTKIAKRYRREVLEPGGSLDAADLVENFLGRPYTFDAFARRFK